MRIDTAEEWVTAKKLAEFSKLVGDTSMPKTKRGVEKALEKNLTKKRLIVRNGKGRRAFEHHRESLPVEYKKLITDAYKLMSSAASCAESTQAVTPLTADAGTAISAGGFSGTALPCSLPPGVVEKRPLSGSAVSLFAADAGSFSGGNQDIQAGMVMQTVQDDRQPNACRNIVHATASR